MDILEKIFGNKDKVKLMRLFLFNPETVFNEKKTSQRVHSSKNKVKKEILILNKARLIRKKNFTTTNNKGKKIKNIGWVLNKQFGYLKPLKNFLINQDLFTDKEFIKKLSAVGGVKLIIISGIFIQDDESRLDLLLVVDKLKESILKRIIRNFEAEIGKEIRYATFNSDEFKYRISMYDKLIRDVFDDHHRVIFDKIGVKR